MAGNASLVLSMQCFYLSFQIKVLHQHQHQKVMSSIEFCGYQQLIRIILKTPTKNNVHFVHYNL
jgi:hypothetical protein